MNESRELHFRVDESFGLLLTQIAREHLIYNHNPEKALAAIEDSFYGDVPRELTLAIIKGDMIVMVDEEQQQFIVTQFDADIHPHLGYEKLDVKGWVERQQTEIRENSQHLETVLREQSIKTKYKTVKVEFSYEQVLKFIAGSNEEMLEELQDNADISSLANIIESTKLYFEKTAKIVSTIEILAKWYPEEFENVRYSTCLEFLGKANMQFSNLITSGLYDADDLEDGLQEYVEAAQNVIKALDEGLKPVNIMDKYSAGWLAPNGDFYGLNGEISLMLHNQIADALQEQGMIPMYEDEEDEKLDIKLNPDSWLEQHGWAKIHDNNINFIGSNALSLYHKPVVYLTPIQIKKIYEYGQICCDGKLLMGWRREFISAPRWRDWIEADPQTVHNKYFE